MSFCGQNPLFFFYNLKHNDQRDILLICFLNRKRLIQLAIKRNHYGSLVELITEKSPLDWLAFDKGLSAGSCQKLVLLRICTQAQIHNLLLCDLAHMWHVQDRTYRERRQVQMPPTHTLTPHAPYCCSLLVMLLLLLPCVGTHTTHATPTDRHTSLSLLYSAYC